MTLQAYQKIKLLHNSILSVELDYTENYSIGDIFYLTEDCQLGGIIKRIKLCTEYRNLGTTFIIIQLI